jgi:hypothetical protein
MGGMPSKPGTFAASPSWEKRALTSSLPGENPYFYRCYDPHDDVL